MDIQEISENMFCINPEVPPLLITHAEGMYIYDSNGMKIMDASGGPLAVNIGHGRKEIAEAAKRSLEKISYVLPVLASEARIELSKRIKTYMPEEFTRIYFCSGGSEANEAAIKFARQYHVLSGKASKYKVISRKLSYHGMTLATLSMGDIKKRQKDFIPLLWGNPHIEPCYCYRCPFGKEYPECDIDCAQDLDKMILAEGPDTISAFIAEPIVASAAGAAVPPPEYFSIIRETCDKYNVIFIADEVVTGFGRTGKKMAMEHFRVMPDITVFAKGVSSGYVPLAGMAVQNKFVEYVERKGAEFQHLYTFSASPLACAIGNEVLKIIENENLISRCREMGDYLKEQLEQLRSIPIVGDVRGKGLLWAIEFVKDQKTREPFPAEQNLKMKIIMNCFLKGIFFYPGYYEDEKGRGDHVMIAPPFIISKDQIDECVLVLRETLEAL
jgi:adenosylmethionine-8-amino-7-oxononanoate aminotransferase